MQTPIGTGNFFWPGTSYGAWKEYCSGVGEMQTARVHWPRPQNKQATVNTLWHVGSPLYLVSYAKLILAWALFIGISIWPKDSFWSSYPRGRNKGKGGGCKGTNITALTVKQLAVYFIKRYPWQHANELLGLRDRSSLCKRRFSIQLKVKNTTDLFKGDKQGVMNEWFNRRKIML